MQCRIGQLHSLEVDEVSESKSHFGSQLVAVMVNPQFSVDSDEQKSEEESE